MPEPSSQAYALLAHAASTGSVEPGAVESLADLADDALPAIQYALELPDRAPRRIAVGALIRIASPGAASALRLFVDRSAPDEADLLPDAVRALVARARAGDTHLEPETVARWSTLPIAGVRAAAAAASDLLDAAAAGPMLLRLSRDADPHVARSALEALEATCAGDDALCWRARLGSPIERVRADAIAQFPGDGSGASLLRAIVDSGDAYALPATLAAAARTTDHGLSAKMLPMAADEGCPPALRVLAFAVLDPADAECAELLVRSLRHPEPTLRETAADLLVRSEARSALRRLSASLPELDIQTLERVADMWARAGGRSRGVLVPGATVALERLAHTCFAAPTCWSAAAAILRALLSSHLAGVVLESPTVAAVARWTWSPDPRVSALARRVHEALLRDVAAPADTADAEVIRALLARGEDEDLLAAIVRLSTPELLRAWLEALIDHLPSASDDVLVRAAPLLGRASDAPRAVSMLERMALHPSAAVRDAARGALASGGSPM